MDKATSSSNKSFDWGGDYSYLLHSIEGKLTSDNNKSNISNISDTPDNIIGTTRKRLRLSLLSDNYNNSIISNTPLAIKQQSQIDELQLLNEQLQDKLNVQIDLNNNLKDKLTKQILYLENDNNKLKESLNDKNTLYYDEKKKWLGKIRELEKQISQLNTAITNASNKSNNSNQIIKNSDTTPEYQYYKDKFNELERIHKQKVIEYTNTITTLQEKLNNLEYEVNDKRRIQEDNMLLIKSQSDMELSLVDLRQKAMELTTLNESLNNKIIDLSSISDTLTNQLDISKQYNSLYINEITSLRQILQSYEIEYNIYNKQRLSGNMNSAFNKSIQLYEDTIKKLQDELDKCRNDAKVVVDLALSYKINNNNTKNNSNENDQNNEEVIEELQNKLLDLQVKYETLQAFTKTDVLPGHTKVLHMISNPYSDSIKNSIHETNSTIPIDELQRLRKQVKTQQSNTENINNSNPNVTSNALTMNTSDGSPINETNANNRNEPDSNKLNKRLKEMFKDRITSFREAVYLLTGYKIDLYSAEEGTNNLRRLRLRSMYAESPDDSLLFQWRGDALELLETPYASKLDSKYFNYLNSFHSVPAFLANITIDLLESQTFMG